MIRLNGFLELEPPSTLSNVVSDEGQRIVQMAETAFTRFKSPVSMQGGRGEVLSEIDNAVLEASAPGWDGNEARPVPFSSALNAKRIIELLPREIPSPSIAIEPDDSAISMEWYAGKRKSIAVSIGSTSRLPFACIYGFNSWSGIADFDGKSIPVVLLDSVRRIVG